MLSRFASKEEALLILRYVLVGLLAVVIQMAFLYIWVSLLGFAAWYLAGAVIGFSVALVAAFLLQKYWTFRDTRAEKRGRQFASYAAIALAGLALNLAVLSFGHAFVDSIGLDFFNGWYLVVQLCALGVSAASTFLANRLVTFGLLAR